MRSVRLRLILGLLALLAGGACLMKSHLLAAQANAIGHEGPAQRDALLCHRQLRTTGWALFAASGLALWLHTRCPLCRIPAHPEKPRC